MRARGPVLLHPGFLEAARGLMRACQEESDTAATEALLEEGLFWATSDRWEGAS